MTKFEKACEMSFNDWIVTIPDEIPKAEYTEKHEKWLKILFNKMRDNEYHSFTTKTVKLILIAAVLSAFILTAFAIPSSREFIIENFDVFSTYKITEHNNNSVNDEIIVGYIPEGFELYNIQTSTKGVIYDYTNTKDYITVSKFSSSIKIEFDTETGCVENIENNGQGYVFYVDKNNYNYLVWNEYDYVYQINGLISKDELLKIAETVK